MSSVLNLHNFLITRTTHSSDNVGQLLVPKFGSPVYPRNGLAAKYRLHRSADLIREHARATEFQTICEVFMGGETTTIHPLFRHATWG